MMVEKVISGGQTGADEAGLQAAFDLGIKTGGTAPRGFRVSLPDGSEGSNPKLGSVFGLQEHVSRNFQKRTIQNVMDSDGTVLFGYVESPGAKLTLRSCTRFEKPCIINPTAQELADWIKQHSIKILNVAGNSVSNFNPHIYEDTYKVVYGALGILGSRY